MEKEHKWSTRELSVLSLQLLCESKTILKVNVYLKKQILKHISHYFLRI